MSRWWPLEKNIKGAPKKSVRPDGRHKSAFAPRYFMWSSTSVSHIASLAHMSRCTSMIPDSAIFVKVEGDNLINNRDLWESTLRKKTTACTKNPTSAKTRRIWVRAKSAYLLFTESLSRTSCAPPSTMETEDTRVSFALSRSSSMVSAPQLHMVERTLERVVAMPSDREPA